MPRATSLESTLVPVAMDNGNDRAEYLRVGAGDVEEGGALVPADRRRSRDDVPGSGPGGAGDYDLARGAAPYRSEPLTEGQCCFAVSLVALAGLHGYAALLGANSLGAACEAPVPAFLLATGLLALAHISLALTALWCSHNVGDPGFQRAYSAAFVYGLSLVPALAAAVLDVVGAVWVWGVDAADVPGRGCEAETAFLFARGYLIGVLCLACLACCACAYGLVVWWSRTHR